MEVDAYFELHHVDLLSPIEVANHEILKNL